jgi:hypothetical protein
MSDPREPLGQVVHQVRRDFEAERSALKDRPGFLMLPWEERHPEQRELDMRIGSAVAARAVADLKAQVREVVDGWMAHYPAGGWPEDLAEAVRQVIGRDEQDQERTDEGEAPNG